MAVRQLAERRGSGIVVQLFWNDSAPPGSDLFVEYRDERQDVYYSLFPSRERALDAFHHPNAYVGRAEHAAPAITRQLESVASMYFSRRRGNRLERGRPPAQTADRSESRS